MFKRYFIIEHLKGLTDAWKRILVGWSVGWLVQGHKDKLGGPSWQQYPKLGWLVSDHSSSQGSSRAKSFALMGFQ